MGNVSKSGIKAPSSVSLSRGANGGVPTIQMQDVARNGHKLWDRQPMETIKAYEAFSMYRDMGTDRKLYIVEKELTPNARNWSYKWNWSKRAEAYDNWILEQARRQVEVGRVEMAVRQSRLGMKMQEMAEKAIDIGNVQVESVGEIVKLAEVGSRVERLARGESTENKATNIQFQWTGPLPSWAPKEVLESGQEYLPEPKQLPGMTEDRADSDEIRRRVAVINSPGEPDAS